MKIRQSLLLCVLLYTSLAEGQATIPSSMIPSVGDTFISRVDTNRRTEVQATNGIFDFSALQNHSTVTNIFRPNTNTLYPSSNLVFTDDSDSSANIYLRKNTDNIALIGLSADNISLPIPIPFNPNLPGNLKYLVYPSTQSTNVTSSDTIKITLPSLILASIIDIDSIINSIPNVSGAKVDSIRINVAITINLKGLASAKIKTPIDNNIDVLKMSRTTSFGISFTLFGKANFLGFPVSLSTPAIAGVISQLFSSLLPTTLPSLTEHVFLSPNFKQPVVNATIDSLGFYTATNYRYITKTTNNPSQIHNLNNQSSFRILHHESDIEVQSVSDFTNALLRVYDLTGRTLWSQKSITNQSIIIPKSNLCNGILILSLQNEYGEQFIEKISIHH